MIVSQSRSYKFCENLHREYWLKNGPGLRIEEVFRRVTVTDDFLTVGEQSFKAVPWVMEVFEWCCDSFVDDRRHKMPQLYLWGIPNCGKTTLLDAFLDMDKVFFARKRFPIKLIQKHSPKLIRPKTLHPPLVTTSKKHLIHIQKHTSKT